MFFMLGSKIHTWLIGGGSELEINVRMEAAGILVPTLPLNNVLTF